MSSFPGSDVDMPLFFCSSNDGDGIHRNQTIRDFESTIERKLFSSILYIPNRGDEFTQSLCLRPLSILRECSKLLGHPLNGNGK
jgi:hypothetical protein